MKTGGKRKEIQKDEVYSKTPLELGLGPKNPYDC